MNKKEVLEIRKQFTPANCALTRIACCYVNHEKEKVMQTREAFLSLPEEEAFKYFDIFKKSLSGKIGKNLLNYDFTTEEEMENESHEILMRLRESGLQDDESLEELYNSVIETYFYNENYYIVLVHGMYDIPGNASDDEEMFDASEEVYSFILCCICPVKLSKAGLSYDSEKNAVKDRIRDWIVGQPDVGFLFPAFNDRRTDVHGGLIYTRKPENTPVELIGTVFGENMPVTYNEQVYKFNYLIEDVLGENCTFSVLKEINLIINELYEESKDDTEPCEIGLNEMRKVFEDAEVPDSCMENFENAFNQIVGEKGKLLLSNIASNEKVSVNVGKTKITVPEDSLHDICTKQIDGRMYLVIPAETYPEINGISANIKE